MYKIIIIVLLAPIILFGSAKIDSLRIQLEKVSGIDKVNTLHELAEEYMDFDLEESIDISTQALNLSKEYDSEKGIINSLWLIGKIWLENNEYKKALYYLLEGNKKFKDVTPNFNYLSALQSTAYTYYFLSQYEQARKFYNKIYTLSTSEDKLEWKALALDGIGTVYSGEGNYEIALTYHRKSLDLYKKSKNYTKIIRLNYLIGSDLANLSRYDTAIEFLYKSLQLSQEKNNLEYLSYCNHAIGIIYGRLKNYKAAINFNFDALVIAQKIGDDYVAANIYQELGEIYFNLAKYDSSLSFLKNSLEVREKENDVIGIALTLHGIGRAYHKQDNFMKARKYYFDAWTIVDKANAKQVRAQLQNSLGALFIDLKNYDEAMSYLIKSSNNILKIKAQNLVQENLRIFSEYYASTNNYKKAYEYLMRFSQLRDSITTQSSHNIAEMQMRYEKGKQEKEKQILRDKIHIQGLEIERIRLERWLTALSFTLFSLISFWGYSRFQVKKRANIILEQRIDQAMMEQEEQQKIIFHQASLSSLGELAASMAHEINQPLQDLKLCAEYVELYMRESGSTDTSLIKSIEEIYQDIERIKQIIDHVRTFSSQQKNYVNELFTVGSVIDNALSMIGKQCVKHGIFLNLDLKKNIGKIKGNPYKLEQVLINVLTNAKDAVITKEKKLQGSIDKQLIIRTYKKEVNIIIEIIDSGVGIKPELHEAIFKPFYTTKVLGEGTGLGLSIVREIVKEFDGEISIESEYMKGATVKIQLPRYMQNSENRKTFKVKKSKSS